MADEGTKAEPRLLGMLHMDAGLAHYAQMFGQMVAATALGHRVTTVYDPQNNFIGIFADRVREQDWDCVNNKRPACCFRKGIPGTLDRCPACRADKQGTEAAE